MEFVFVIGTGRCGSTLLHEVLARHPSFGFVSNIDDNLMLPMTGRFNSPIYRALPAALSAKGRVRYAPSEGYRLLDKEVSPLISRPIRDLDESDVTPWLESRFRRFFASRARSQKRPAFIHKFTGWPRARFIHKILPEAKFIHVYRDGRAVANSLVQMPWWRGHRGPSEWGWGPLPKPYARAWESSGRSFVVLAGLEWNLLMDAFEEARAGIPPSHWLEIRYEELVGDPRAITSRALDFIGLDWNAEFEKGFTKHRFGSARTEAYREELTSRDVVLLNKALSHHLERLGYLPASLPQKRVAQ